MNHDDPDASTSVLIMLARLEGKVDAALAHQNAKVDEHDRRLDDFEPRLRALEVAPTVSPKAMWTGLGIVAALVSALAPFLDRLYR